MKITFCTPAQQQEAHTAQLSYYEASLAKNIHSYITIQGAVAQLDERVIQSLEGQSPIGVKVCV